jgi:hypothetical protein
MQKLHKNILQLDFQHLRTFLQLVKKKVPESRFFAPDPASSSTPI